MKGHPAQQEVDAPDVFTDQPHILAVFFLCALFFSVCAVCVFVSVCRVCVCIFVCVVLVIDVSLAIKLSFSRTTATHNICTHTHTRTTHARTHTHTQVTMSGTAANGGLVGEHELGTNSN